MDVFCPCLNHWSQGLEVTGHCVIRGHRAVRGRRADSMQQEVKKKKKPKTTPENQNVGASSNEEEGDTSSSLTSTKFPDVVAGGQRSKIKVQGCGGPPPPPPRTGSRSALRAFLTGGGGSEHRRLRPLAPSYAGPKSFAPGCRHQITLPAPSSGRVSWSAWGRSLDFDPSSFITLLLQ